MDVKTILAISALVIGVILIFKDQVMLIFSGLKKGPLITAPVLGSPLTGQVVAQQAAAQQAVQQPQANNLDSLILSLDSKKDKAEIDYLIDNLGPKLMRRRLIDES